MNMDSWGEVINGDSTYREIADALRSERSILIGWTDEMGSHFDILFTHRAYSKGYLQRGVRKDDLFVSIMGVGAHGFEVKDIPMHPNYIAEKFSSGVYMGNSKDKLAELLNEIRLRLAGGPMMPMGTI